MRRWWPDLAARTIYVSRIRPAVCPRDLAASLAADAKLATGAEAAPGRRAARLRARGAGCAPAAPGGASGGRH